MAAIAISGCFRVSDSATKPNFLMKLRMLVDDPMLHLNTEFGRPKSFWWRARAGDRIIGWRFDCESATEPNFKNPRIARQPQTYIYVQSKLQLSTTFHCLKNLADAPKSGRISGYLDLNRRRRRISKN